MDQFMVDLTDVTEAAVNDEVVFMGIQQQERITADEIAKRAGTISYEIVSRMSSRMPRIYPGA
jgi:alanine racemase